MAVIRKQDQPSLIIALTLLVRAMANSNQWPKPDSEFPLQCSPSCPWTKSNETDATPGTSLPNSTSGPEASGNASSAWCGGMEFPEPPLQANLPKCKNITVRNGTEFAMAGSRENWTEAHEDFRPSGDNVTATICLPLSPRLLNCSQKRLNRKLYAYDSSTMMLRNCRTNDIIGIRDYYTFPESGEVVGCVEPVGSGLGQGCQSLDYRKYKYQVFDANDSIQLLSTDSVAFQPDYETVNATHIRLCHSGNATSGAELLPCEILTLLKTNYSIGKELHGEHFDLGDYLIVEDKTYHCPSQNQSLAEEDVTFNNFKAVFQTLSSVFVVSAFVIHLLLPKLNHHAKPLLCHMFSTAVMYVSYSSRVLLQPVPTPASCYSLFAVMYISGTSSFFWLSVLAFDLWVVFAGQKICSRSHCGTSRKLVYYSLYAFGIPLVLVAICLLLETQPLLQEALNIRLGIWPACWFTDRKSDIVFSSAPLTVLMLVNLVLYCWILVSLKRSSREAAEIVNKKRNKQLLFVSIKLFGTMGLIYTVGLTLFAMDVRGKEAIYLAGTIESIQGILLFLIYICKPATYHLIRDTFCPRPPPAIVPTTPQRNKRSTGVSLESVITTSTNDE